MVLGQVVNRVHLRWPVAARRLPAPEDAPRGTQHARYTLHEAPRFGTMASKLEFWAAMGNPGWAFADCLPGQLIMVCDNDGVCIPLN